MHFWSLQSYSSTESNTHTHTHTLHTHTQTHTHTTHAHTLTQIHTLTHIHTHTQHTNTPYGRSSERVRKMASQTSQTMQLIGCGDGKGKGKGRTIHTKDGKGKGKGRTIHTKDIEIYVAASPSETKIGAMNWSRSNTTAHAIFWRKLLTCLCKDSSVGFCNTANCVENENMHIYVWRSQFTVQLACSNNIRTCRAKLHSESWSWSWYITLLTSGSLA